MYVWMYIFGTFHIYVVNIKSWSPSNSIGNPSNSIGSPSNSTVYRPTMSTTPTDLNIGKKHNCTCTQYVHVQKMSSDSIHVRLRY